MKKLRIGLVTRREMKGYVFLIPWLIGFAAFFLVPLVQGHEGAAFRYRRRQRQTLPRLHGARLDRIRFRNLPLP